VSVAGAAANLADEDPGWNLASVARAATATWNGLLDRIAVQGGSVTDQRTFYTALYHSLLFPSVFSDDDSRYVGFDHRVHALGPGQVQFSNISEDDIYRSEVPLLAMLLPGPTSQMVQSMLRDADQTPGGFLPRWVIADNDAGQWDGDSADPVIADAYAYGARGFDLDQALAAMVRGATRQSPSPLDGRANLAADESQGWVPGPTFDVTSFPYTDGGSETLEYSTDDFAISRMAQAAGDTAEASAFARRAQHWQNLFDPATGYLAARQTDGSFPAGPAFQPAGPADQAQGVAQVGFEEGNAVQYTWAVPQNLAGLFTLMGGDHQAVAQLNTYFTQLNATRFAPYDWAGNEPGEGVPFEYDYAGAPWQTQAVVRRIMTQLYPLAPANEPGEDDLGSLSSWYVWSALGLYPETPGVADLAMTSPLFARSVISEGNGHTLTIEGRGAPDPYIQSARLAWGSGGSAPWSRPWLPSEALTGGATLSVKLGTSPDPAWGAASTAAPPSFQAGAAPAVAFTAPGGAVGVSTSVPAPVELGVQEALPTGGGTRTVAWHVASGADVTVSPSSGMIRVVGNRSTVPLQVTSAVPGTHAVTLVLTQGGAALPALTLDVVVGS
jgi:predicted alpha-1,2-mannosidase